MFTVVLLRSRLLVSTRFILLFEKAITQRVHYFLFNSKQIEQEVTKMFHLVGVSSPTQSFGRQA